MAPVVPFPKTSADVARGTVAWDGPLLVIENGEVLLQVECLGKDDRPVVPVTWVAHAGALGLSGESALKVVADSEARPARLEGIGCVPASDCRPSLVFLRFGDARPSGDEVEEPPPHDLAAAVPAAVLAGDVQVRRLQPLAGPGVPNCAPRPGVKAPSAGVECRSFVVRDGEARVLLQLWAYDDATPEGYASWQVYARARANDEAFTAWRPIRLAAYVPDLWSISGPGGEVRLLMRASSGGVGAYTALQMMRIDAKGELEVGRRYAAGGHACD